MSLWRNGALSPRSNFAAYDSMATLAFDFYAEVIDTDAGEVLVSQGPAPVGTARPWRWFGGWSGYRQEEGPDGLPVVKVVELRLVPKS